MQSSIPYLSLAIWIPIVSGLVILAIGSDARAPLIRWLALCASVIGFVVTIPVYTGFDTNSAALQFVERTPWIERFAVNYALGIDGIALWFVLLTAFITVIVVVAAWRVIEKNVAGYMASFLILSGLMIGVFSATDGLLFYVFFEATLIPMYLIIGIWGGPNRVYASIKFFLYTFLGSLLTLVAIIFLWYKAGGSFDIATWQKLPLTIGAQTLVFFAFFMAFAVKVPMWPVHTWLPDAHVEAPTGGSVVLAAIMLKLGAYGFVRFSLPIAPDAAHQFAPFIITLSLVAVIYVGFVAMVQTDMKKLVAYSSIAHMGFVTLGFFIFSELGMEGAIAQMISHGFVSGAMFLCIGVVYDRMHTRLIADYGGVVNTMPKFAAFFLFFSMANCGLPATSGFVGRVHGDPRGRAVQFLDRPARGDGADPRRRLLAVDVQARRVRQGRQRARGGIEGHRRARVRHARRAGGRLVVHGRHPQAVHRRDARIGRQPARARCADQALKP